MMELGLELTKKSVIDEINQETVTIHILQYQPCVSDRSNSLIFKEQRV